MNGEKLIGRTLDGVLRQSIAKKNYEIIVVDDGSIDGTGKIARTFKKIRYFKIKHGGPSIARNFGVTRSAHDIVVFVDCGCVPKEDWLEKILLPFKEKRVVGVAGTYNTLNKDSWVARFFGYEIEHRHEKMKELERIDFVGTYNCAYRKGVFFGFDGFSTKFTSANAEDPDLSYRISAAGHQIVFQPDAVVYGDHPDKLSVYLKKKKSRAYWKVMLYKRNTEKVFGDTYTPKTLLPQLFLMGLSLLSLPFILILPKLLYYSLFFMLFSVGLNLDFYRFLWRKEKKLTIMAPFVFVLRNIYSVFGIAHGVLDFVLKKN
ncbi:hypothetical protein A3K63_00630 [Candidatus Micrarchaeota archaeon RBG_16_49_10]|nr:MAG: hypothetical protein A3K63_00630 [Candidatus Micrarchaeota archaeon RBG_16_49_10]